jgi:hypothetical protein
MKNDLLKLLPEPTKDQIAKRAIATLASLGLDRAKVAYDPEEFQLHVDGHRIWLGNLQAQLRQVWPWQRAAATRQFLSFLHRNSPTGRRRLRRFAPTSSPACATPSRTRLSGSRPSWRPSRTFARVAMLSAPGRGGRELRSSGRDLEGAADCRDSLGLAKVVQVVHAVPRSKIMRDLHLQEVCDLNHGEGIHDQIVPIWEDNVRT